MTLSKMFLIQGFFFFFFFFLKSKRCLESGHLTQLLR